MERKASAKTLGLVQLALLGALIFILAFTPFIGYIPLGFTRATIVHIPVIINDLAAMAAEDLLSQLLLHDGTALFLAVSPAFHETPDTGLLIHIHIPQFIQQFLISFLDQKSRLHGDEGNSALLPETGDPS